MKKHQSLIIFENPHLEKLTHVHPIIPLLVWAPIVSYFAWRSVAVDSFSILGLLGMALVGFFFWTLTEYVLHRKIFHFKPKNAWQRKLHFIIHGNHHEDPNDPTRLVMPPAGSIIIGFMLYCIYRLPLGPIWVDPFFTGFSIGYLTYDYTHYSIHHFKPRTRFGRWNKQHHMIHHFVAHEARWGVSSPFWDYVFGTVQEKQPAQAQAGRLSPSARSAQPSREQTI
jgi:sterol desaturase/sphingolipid hydroxylase (fatty acid hydroxylase superfamily)